MSATKPESAATDIADFFAELDGGNFDTKLSVALSQVAAATMDNDKTGEVNLAFKFKRIPGTAQIHCEHTLKFIRPTLDGKAGEEEKRTTPMHVGKYGKLTFAPPNQLEFMDKKTGEIY